MREFYEVIALIGAIGLAWAIIVLYLVHDENKRKGGGAA